MPIWQVSKETTKAHLVPLHFLGRTIGSDSTMPGSCLLGGHRELYIGNPETLVTCVHHMGASSLETGVHPYWDLTEQLLEHSGDVKQLLLPESDSRELSGWILIPPRPLQPLWLPPLTLLLLAPPLPSSPTYLLSCLF